MQWIDVGEKFWWCQYWLFTSVHLFQIIQDILKWTLPKEKSIQNIFSEKFLQRKRTNWTWEYGNQNPFNKFLNRPEFSLFCFAQPLPAVSYPAVSYPAVSHPAVSYPAVSYPVSRPAQAKKSWTHRWRCCLLTIRIESKLASRLCGRFL